MIEWHPLFRCGCCGKRLYQDEGIETRPCRDQRYFVLLKTCTNPRCKVFGKTIEAKVPYHIRAGRGWIPARRGT